MKLLPQDAIIPQEKLRDYILSMTHPDGYRKAVYLARLGYFQDDWERLDFDLREQHLSQVARIARPSPYGQKYEILGPLTGPNGATAWIRTIWIVRTGEVQPRFVTLIPEKRP